MKTERTSRGFAFIEFKDEYEKKCSIQKSSLVTGDSIWFGVDDPEPMVMARDAKRLGVEAEKTCGWVPYPIPMEVSLHTRMHLTRQQVKQLLPILRYFAEKGELPDVS